MREADTPLYTAASSIRPIPHKMLPFGGTRSGANAGRPKVDAFQSGFVGYPAAPGCMRERGQAVMKDEGRGWGLACGTRTRAGRTRIKVCET